MPSRRDSAACGEAPQATALSDERRAARRSSARSRQRAAAVIAAVLEAADSAVIVLNAQREIVAANERGRRARRPARARSRVQGRRGARHRERARRGDCSILPACRQCGALGTILRCHGEGRSIEAECLLRTALPGGEGLKLNVRATPLEVEGYRLAAVSLRDVSAEKRRDALEQLFPARRAQHRCRDRRWSARLRRGSVPAAAASERIDQLHRAARAGDPRSPHARPGRARRLVLEPAPVRALSCSRISPRCSPRTRRPGSAASR